MSKYVSENAVITIIYFENEEATHINTIFKGNIKEFQKRLNQNFDRFKQSEDFNGFREGQHFYIQGKILIAFAQDVTKNPYGIITNAIYKAGPENLNPDKINYINLRKYRDLYLPIG